MYVCLQVCVHICMYSLSLSHTRKHKATQPDTGTARADKHALKMRKQPKQQVHGVYRPICEHA